MDWTVITQDDTFVYEGIYKIDMNQFDVIDNLASIQYVAICYHRDGVDIWGMNDKGVEMASLEKFYLDNHLTPNNMTVLVSTVAMFKTNMSFMMI